MLNEKEQFDMEAEFMDRVFYKYMIMLSIYKKKKDDIKEGMPDYMFSVCGEYCKDCATGISLNGFLNKWKIFINNREDLLHYKEYITGKLTEYIDNIIIRFSYYDNCSLRDLCGCVNYNREIKENKIWKDYIEDTKGTGVSGYIVLDNLQMISIHCNSSDEYKNKFKNSLKWRTDLNKYLGLLREHLNYFKRVPHKNYRDNILIPLIFATNNDCVKNIIQYL